MDTGTPAISTAEPSPTEPAERSPHTAPRRPRQTSNDAQIPAESVRITDVSSDPGGAHVRVTDNPANGRGRAYLIERELEQDGNGALQALIRDYVEQAERHGEIPMNVPLSRYLAHVEE